MDIYANENNCQDILNCKHKDQNMKKKLKKNLCSMMKRKKNITMIWYLISQMK